MSMRASTSLSILAAVAGLLAIEGAGAATSKAPDKRALTAPSYRTCPGPERSYDVGAPSSSGDDTRNIQSAVDKALSDLQAGTAGAATVRLKPKSVYRLKGREDNFDAVLIKSHDLKNLAIGCLTIDGTDSTLSLAPTTNAFYMFGCKNCTIENLRIQADPIPLLEGHLLSVVARGNGTARVQIDDGEIRPLPPDYGRGIVVGSHAAIAIFHSAEPDAFPNRLAYPSVAPFLAIDSLEQASANTADVIFSGRRSGTTARQTPQLLLQVAPQNTRVAIVDPVLNQQKNSALEAVNTAPDTTATRIAHPLLTSRFFTGGRLPTILVESSDTITFRNIAISGVAGAGFFLSGNRGHMVLDKIEIVPRKPGGLLSIGSDGIDVHNNEYGPSLRNSRIAYTADDALNLLSFPYWASAVHEATADLNMDNRLAAAPIAVGDRFLLIDTPNGTRLGQFTVKSVTAGYSPGSETHFNVTFDRPLPSVETAGARSPTTFINLDMANKEAVIDGNLFIGGQRNGVVVGSGATIANNAFVGLGLHAVHYLGLLRPNPALLQPRGIWGDFGAVEVRSNTVIDTNNGLLKQGAGQEDGGFRAEFAGLTVRDNTVFGPRRAVSTLTAGSAMPISAKGNRIVAPQSPGNAAEARLDTLGAAPVPFAVDRISDAALWAAKCQATATWHLC